MQNIIDFKNVPTTRYQGSKRKILPFIYKHLKDIEFDTVLDACGGSGSVSYLFKKMNKTVTYNDKLKFNYIIGKALIENQEVTFLPKDIENLFNHSGNGHFIEKTFKGIYYPTRENKWLDLITDGVLNMNHYTGKTLDFKKCIAYYALFQASLIKRPFNLFHRKNLNIRTNDVIRHFGNKTTWEKSFKVHFNTFIDEANKCIFKSEKKCTALNKSVFEIKEHDYDLVYLDPPYLNKEGTNETSNYLKCYHFLEGLANYDKWENFIDQETVNLRFKELEMANDFKKENICATFEELIKKFQNSKIVLSYKIGGIPSVKFLVQTMKKYKKTVYTRTSVYQYALNRQNSDARKNREVLIIGV